MANDPQPGRMYREMPIQPADKAALKRCETIIEKGLDTFREVGLALLEIRTSKLYSPGYSSFESYCRDRWGISARHANRQITSAQVTNIINGTGEAAALLGESMPAPTAESQARELHSLRDNPAAVKQVWRHAYENAAGDRGPTAAEVRQARIDYEQERARRQQQREAKKAAAPKPPTADYASNLLQRLDWEYERAIEIGKVMRRPVFGELTTEQLQAVAGGLGRVIGGFTELLDSIETGG